MKHLVTRTLGIRAEDRALAYLLKKGLELVTRNYKTTGRGGGEIDLILHDPRQGSPVTLVFVEVRSRKPHAFGGALASIDYFKRQRLQFAAQCYLQRFSAIPPCRFDVVAIEGEALHWIEGAWMLDT